MRYNKCNPYLKPSALWRSCKCCKWYFNLICLYALLFAYPMTRDLEIPGLWLISKIMPIHKNGDKKDVCNNRPVANLSVLVTACLQQRCFKAGPDTISTSKFLMFISRSITSPILTSYWSLNMPPLLDSPISTLYHIVSSKKDLH